MRVSRDIQKFRQHLAETIAWCGPRANIHDPVNCLRTPALRPANKSRTPDNYGHYEYTWGTIEQNEATVATLAAERSRLLAGTVPRERMSRSPHLAGGRILVVAPEMSDTSGLSEAESGGFIDGFDLPAWDTWIAYIGEPSLRAPEEESRSYGAWQNYVAQYPPDKIADWPPITAPGSILCWIPALFVEQMNVSMLVNPTWCLAWAPETKPKAGYNPALTRVLEMARLLLP